jgi:NhaB family Na+:H+ antiporter
MKLEAALDSGLIDRDHFDKLVIAINTGTNLPSVATPNGQAAFLFLLTSALAPLINLSYMRMVIMALPYTIVLTIVGYLGVINLA